MNIDELVRRSLIEQAAEEPLPEPGLADRVIAVRRRRRSRRIAAVAAAAVVVAGLVVAVPRIGSEARDVHPLGPVLGGGPEPVQVTAHVDQSPPRMMIAAGDTVLAAYYTTRTVEVSDTLARTERTYWLLDPDSGRYVKAPQWSFVAVAPGLRKAAVLERKLPADRVGILDLRTRKVERWIPVRHAAALAFSHDGTKVVATTYGDDPDLKDNPRLDRSHGEQPSDVPSPSRNGFAVVDVAAGSARWAAVVPGGNGMQLANLRQDFAFSHDDTLVWAGVPSDETPHEYHTLDGAPVEAPPNEEHVLWYVDAGLSPDGKRVAGDFAGGRTKTASWLLDARTGDRLTKICGQQLLAWAGNGSLIAWDIGKGDDNEFHQRLVLVTVGSDKELPLSGFRGGHDGQDGRWEPVFAQR